MARPTADRLRIVILVVWIAGFLIGMASHVLDLIAGGADTYAGFPPALRVFWLSLTVLDPLTVLLLLLRKRAGIILGLVVILADIAVNWTVYFSIGGNPLFGVVNQTVFAIFLLATAPALWRWFRSAQEQRRRPPQA
ncbi:hypothetical protein [Compostimonas suwonensis]|uniref:Uncharacterized protein n=1 Tax=Compostimonas suwonensis TaxID=1048394 RepID=A0A2M9C027_9MICO|nr:hypothetical protein [Compostimonas suwonensis]PJJ63686.1 hypothetical protein CLV54_1358 [Compostimonas suwonensis]